MKKFIMVLFLLGLSSISARPVAAQNKNFSGSWRLDAGRCSLSEISPYFQPDIRMDIRHTEGRISIKKAIIGTTQTINREASYTTDRKESLHSGQGIKDLKGVCYWENDRLIIDGEEEGAMAAMSSGGGEPARTEYFRYSIREEYSLSPDGKTLTIVTVIRVPEGEKKGTYVFDRTDGLPVC